MKSTVGILCRCFSKKWSTAYKLDNWQITLSVLLQYYVTSPFLCAFNRLTFCTHHFTELVAAFISLTNCKRSVKFSPTWYYSVASIFLRRQHEINCKQILFPGGYTIILVYFYNTNQNLSSILAYTKEFVSLFNVFWNVTRVHTHRWLYNKMNLTT